MNSTKKFKDNFYSIVCPYSQGTMPSCDDWYHGYCTGKYGRQLEQFVSHDDDVAVAAKMLQLSRQVNQLKERVEAESLHSRKSSMWKDASTIDNFPNMTEEQLHVPEMTCGSYQLKLSRCYIQEHLHVNHDILVHIEDPQLLKVKMQIRHVSSKAHILWISYDEVEVTAWYCLCKTAPGREWSVCVFTLRPSCGISGMPVTYTHLTAYSIFRVMNPGEHSLLSPRETTLENVH
uniref:Uncharacterized protein n=1 Tax=Magallana gigas TaxID=29159 RepID=K1QBM6_MAGGI